MTWKAEYSDDTPLANPITDRGSLALLMDVAVHAGRGDGVSRRELIAGVRRLHDRASADTTYGKAQRRAYREVLQLLGCGLTGEAQE